MAKDYFQDILPPDDPQRRADQGSTAIPIRKEVSPPPVRSEAPASPGPENRTEDIAQTPERSIRNITVDRRSRFAADTAGYMISPPRRAGGRWLLWLLALASIALLGVLALVALRSTVVSVTPRAQALTLSPSTGLTAYPQASAPAGALSYDARSLDLDDSEVVPSKGTVHVDQKASGTITVYNNFSSRPIKFIASTRFQSGDGKIFRTPAAVLIPGKNAAGPGTVTITIVADQAGEAFNVPAGKFTIPGLKAAAAEYTQVYGQSMQSMSGGFSGDRPGVDEQAMAAAKAAIRSRLEAKARERIATEDDTIVIPDLVQIRYGDEAPTPEASGGVRIHETAHVSIPSFKNADFAAAVGAAFGVSGQPLTFEPGRDFAASLTNASSTVGTDPLSFTLAGSGTIIWTVDASALQNALAGKPQTAFEGIVKQFPGVQEAHARVEPFWSANFPSDPHAIGVSIGVPQVSESR